MSELVARCRECGHEHSADVVVCPVCHGACGWWCHSCEAWLPERRCPSCGGFLLVPDVVELGSFPAGTVVPIRIGVRNPGARPLEFTASPDDFALTIPSARRTLRGRESFEVHGTLALGDLPPGRRSYRVRFESALPVETELVVEVVPPVVRLEFEPREVAVRVATPGKLVRRNIVLKNAGNVPVAAGLHPSESWLTVSPPRVELAPGGTATLKLIVKTRKAEHGTRVATLVARGDWGEVWQAVVRLRLPEPELEASPIDLGTVRPGRPVYETITLRNTGKVRLACTLATDQSWLAVTPKRVNVPRGGEKLVKVRAHFTENLAGRREGGVVVSFDGDELLRVPVTAVCHKPKPVLAPIRRQTLGSVANDLPVVRRFRVSNTGDGRLECSVSADVPWIEVLTPSLSVSPGKKRRVEFRIDAPRLAQGANTATIRVSSNGGDADVQLSVVVVEPQPELEVLGDAELGTVADDGAATGFLSVRNVGVGLLALRSDPEDARVTVSPADATIAPGPPTRLSVAVAVDGLNGGEHAFGVRFSGNGGDGRAEVRFRLPVEVLDVPSVIDLGDRAAGRPTGEALRIRNTGTDTVSLRVLADDSWVRPATERVTVRPGELVAVPFTLDLADGVYGPVGSVIRVEGRTLRHSVVVRAVARKIDIVVNPAQVQLGDMTHGEERAIALRVENRGDVAAEVRESHTKGDLEVWVRRQIIQPGATATVAVRVRMHAKGVGWHIKTMVKLADEAPVRFAARVRKSMTPRILAAVSGGIGLLAGAALGATVGWFFGAAVVLAGLVAAYVFVATSEG